MQNTLFTSAVTGDEKLRTDVIAIVQNEITVVDEQIPSPGEIQSDETIVCVRQVKSDAKGHPKS